MFKKSLRAMFAALAIMSIAVTPVFAGSTTWALNASVKISAGSTSLVNTKISESAKATWNGSQVTFTGVSTTAGTPKATVVTKQEWSGGWLWFPGTRKLISTYTWSVQKSSVCKATVTARLEMSVDANGGNGGTRTISLTGCSGIAATIGS